MNSRNFQVSNQEKMFICSTMEKSLSNKTLNVIVRSKHMKLIATKFPTSSPYQVKNQQPLLSIKSIAELSQCVGRSANNSRDDDEIGSIIEVERSSGSHSNIGLEQDETEENFERRVENEESGNDEFFYDMLLWIPLGPYKFRFMPDHRENENKKNSYDGGYFHHTSTASRTKALLPNSPA